MNAERFDMPVQRFPNIAAWKFLATMQIRIPLRVLELHGQVYRGKEPPQVTTSMHEGIWLPYMDDPLFLAFDVRGEMASEIGPIPKDGGQYLVFLKVVRGIAESAASIIDRRHALLEELEKPEWQFFVDKHDGVNSICARLFPSFLSTIPRLSASSRNALHAAGLTCPAAMSAAQDGRLLAIRGIGPAALAAIRASCLLATDPACEFVDNAGR